MGENMSNQMIQKLENKRAAAFKALRAGADDVRNKLQKEVNALEKQAVAAVKKSDSISEKANKARAAIKSAKTNASVKTQRARLKAAIKDLSVANESKRTAKAVLKTKKLELADIDSDIRIIDAGEKARQTVIDKLEKKRLLEKEKEMGIVPQRRGPKPKNKINIVYAPLVPGLADSLKKKK